MEHKYTVPAGIWTWMRKLDPNTTPQELAAVIRERTGVQLAPEQIQVRSTVRFSGMISFTNENITDLLNWALQDDTIRGKAIEFCNPKERAA